MSGRRNDLDLLDEFTNFLPEMKEEQQRLAEIERQKTLARNTETKKEPKTEPKLEPEDSKTFPKRTIEKLLLIFSVFL